MDVVSYGCGTVFKSLRFMLHRDCDAVDDAVRLIKIVSSIPVPIRRLLAFILKPLVSSRHLLSSFIKYMKLSLAATSYV